MRLKIFLPSFWVMNKEFNAECDKFYRDIIENRNEIKFIWANGHYLCFKYRSCIYSAWIESRWFAYLTTTHRCRIGKLRITPFYESVSTFRNNISQLVYLAMGRKEFLPEGRPARETLIDFYEKVELPALQKLKEYNLYDGYDGDIEGYDYVMLNGNKGKIIKTDREIIFSPK